MNYHDNSWVFQKVREHYSDVLRMFPEDRVVAVCLAGSQNYNLDVESSDVDTKAIIIPSFKELATNAKPISTTYIRDNGEQIDLKDIRIMAECWKKQNLNFIEILFTNYFMPYASNDFFQFQQQAEKIARYNPWKAVKTIQGLALTKYSQLKRDTPSHQADLGKYGYSRKELHHLLRIEEFIERYIKNEEPYYYFLHSNQEDYLKKVKVNGVASCELAEDLAIQSMEHINLLADHYCSTHVNEADPEVGKLIDDFVYCQMEKSIRKELGNGN